MVEKVETQSKAGSLVQSLKKQIEARRLRRRRAKQAKKKGGNRRLTIGLLILVTGLLASFFGAVQYLSPDPTGQQLSLDELTALAKAQRVESAVFLDEDNRLVGHYVAQPLVAPNPPPRPDSNPARKDAKGDSPRGGKQEPTPIETDVIETDPRAPSGEGDFWLAYPKTGAAFAVLSDVLGNSPARVTVDPQSSKALVRFVSTYLLPLLILASVFGLLLAGGKGGGSGIGEVMTFGTIGKKRQKKGHSGSTTFADVGSAEEAVAELKEVVDYLTNPARYDEIGAVPPKGVLLFGPPGCGKTLLAKAVAGEAGVPFFSVAGAEFVESLVGVGAARVRDLFARVRAVAPAIVFIDELDAAGRRRGHGGGEGGSDEREQTLNQMLVEMDGFEVSAGVVVIGATNRPDILDPALLRPGRFDRHITVEQPDHPGRVAILGLHARGKPIASTVDFEYVAKRTPGFSGADLASVINEGALLSLRQNKAEIETEELEEAIQRVLNGPKKRGRVLSQEEEKRAAHHESGHAIVAAALGRGESVHRVSILARGRGIGLTGMERDAGAVLLTTAQLYARLVTEMGGLAAEELTLGDVSTGAEQDLERATDLARDMVARYGMSPTLGRARLMASDVDRFLGSDSGFSQLSAGTHEQLDQEVRRLLATAEHEALRILAANEKLLNEMASRLETEETLEGLELNALLTRVPIEDHFNLTPFSPGATPDGPTAANGKGAIRKPREVKP